MLLIVLLLCLLTSVYVAVRRRDALSFCFLGMSVSNMIMFGGIIVYIAKMGGLAATQENLLFLSRSVQHWLMYLPLSMDKLGYTVALGRTLFPVFTIFAALETTMIPLIRRNSRGIHLLLLILPAAFLVYYFPPFFRVLTAQRITFTIAMMKVSLSCIILYLLAAAALIVFEYHSITFPFFKRSFGYTILSVLGMEALYVLYATKDPAQIYNMYIVEYIQMGISTYIGPGLSQAGWMILIVCTMCFQIFGSYGMLRYTKLEYDETRQDMILKRKFDTAGTGISVFVHGIKNQLLSSKVLNKRLTRALEADPPDLTAARETAAQLSELTEGMLARMNELYWSVKLNALVLQPVPVSEIMQLAAARFREKYPEGQIRIIGEPKRLVLADKSHLAEALYNLLTNGYEAAEQAGKLPAVELIYREERLWTVLEIKDNGGGIPKELENKIFDPFYTSKNTNRNWGMGLYYVRKIVKGHYGSLRLESHVPEGSRFFVMLPVYGLGR